MDSEFQLKLWYIADLVESLVVGRTGFEPATIAAVHS